MAMLASILQLHERESRYESLVEELRYPAYDSPDKCIICTIIGCDSSCYPNIYFYLDDEIILDGLTVMRNENLFVMPLAIPSSLVTSLGGV